jgi:hypothetical protein
MIRRGVLVDGVIFMSVLSSLTAFVLQYILVDTGVR